METGVLSTPSVQQILPKVEEEEIFVSKEEPERKMEKPKE